MALAVMDFNIKGQTHRMELRQGSSKSQFVLWLDNEVEQEFSINGLWGRKRFSFLGSSVAVGIVDLGGLYRKYSLSLRQPLSSWRRSSFSG